MLFLLGDETQSHNWNLFQGGHRPRLPPGFSGAAAAASAVRLHDLWPRSAEVHRRKRSPHGQHQWVPSVPRRSLATDSLDDPLSLCCSGYGGQGGGSRSRRFSRRSSLLPRAGRRSQPRGGRRHGALPEPARGWRQYQWVHYRPCRLHKLC